MVVDDTYQNIHYPSLSQNSQSFSEGMGIFPVQKKPTGRELKNFGQFTHRLQGRGAVCPPKTTYPNY